MFFADDADTTYIGEAAFMGATALEGFTVPAGVSIVGDYAFCFSGVRTVDMSAADEITVLPEYIFGENTRLATILSARKSRYDRGIRVLYGERA